MSEVDCIDLRLWARANRYRWRFEESYHVEKPENRGDGRWFVEVMCRYGSIYPYGGEMLLAYCSRRMKRQVGGLAGVKHHQFDDDGEVFRFPADRLDEVAAILKPKRLPGKAELSPEQLANLQEGRKLLESSRLESPESTQTADEGEG